jgi:hypothetical protein
MRTPTLSALLLLLAACATAPPLPPGEVVGEEMAAQDVVRFSVVDANPPAYFERVVLVEATVVAVCQNAGCWMTVEDEGRTAMVRWETGCGGKYAFPADMAGSRVLIQGTFYPVTLSADEAEHLAFEAGGEAGIEAGDTYEFNASSILVLED